MRLTMTFVPLLLPYVYFIDTQLHRYVPRGFEDFDPAECCRGTYTMFKRRRYIQFAGVQFRRLPRPRASRHSDVVE